MKDMIIVAKISSHSIIITMTPPPFDFIPKKIIDQTALIVSCIQNKIKASKTLTSANPSCQIRKTEIPINTYNVVQTGPNAQFGSVYGGFFSVGYQFGIALYVNRLPMPPAAKQARTLIISFTILFN